MKTFEINVDSRVKAEDEFQAIHLFRTCAKEDNWRGTTTVCREVEPGSPVFLGAHFLMICQGQWAKGETLGEVMDKLAPRGLPRHPFTVHLIHPETTVDGLGNFEFPTGQHPRLVWKRG